MNFDQWWESLTTKEQFLLGRHNARFVWDAAATAEREACAKMCEAQEDEGGEWDVQQQCANRIRARGNT